MELDRTFSCVTGCGEDATLRRTPFEDNGVSERAVIQYGIQFQGATDWIAFTIHARHIAAHLSGTDRWLIIPWGHSTDSIVAVRVPTVASK